MISSNKRVGCTFLFRRLCAAAPATLIFFYTTAATAQKTLSPAEAQLEHGRYLVQQVGLCGDCHTPRDDHGQPIESRALQGADIGFKPLAEMPWGSYAPPIAGLPGFTDDQAMTFLTTRKNAAGNPPRPPMPPYRLNRKDAAAVLSYLRSIAPQKKEEAAAKH